MTTTHMNQHTYAFEVVCESGNGARIIRAGTAEAAQADALDIAAAISQATGNEYLVMGCGPE